MTDRVIMITGGSGRLGRQLVTHYLVQSAAVVFTSLSAQSVARVMAEHRSNSHRLVGLAIDFTEPDFAAELSRQLLAKGLYPDGLVNNARCHSFLAIGQDGLVTRDNFVNEYVVDVVAPYELTMALARQAGSRLKAVVNVGSMYGCVAPNPSLYADFDGQSPIHYGVAKAALCHLTKELAVRLAPQGIRVNCVAFGGVEGKVDREFTVRYSQLVPMRRMLTAEEVVGPVDYLLSGASSAMTGHTMAADGGWGVW